MAEFFPLLYHLCLTWRATIIMLKVQKGGVSLFLSLSKFMSQCAVVKSLTVTAYLSLQTLKLLSTLTVTCFCLFIIKNVCGV